MTLCDWIVLIELAALGIAGVRIWQLGLDRDRAVEELGLVVQTSDTLWRLRAERDFAMQRVREAEIRLERVDRDLNVARGWLARTVRIARRLRAERNALSAELDAAYLASAVVRIERYRGDAHADRAQQLARRVTELEEKLHEDDRDTHAVAAVRAERDSARRWLATTVRIARRLRADREDKRCDAMRIADLLSQTMTERNTAAWQVITRQRRLDLLEGELTAAKADRDAHADRAQQLARRVTELEEKLHEAGTDTP